MGAENLALDDFATDLTLAKSWSGPIDFAERIGKVRKTVLSAFRQLHRTRETVFHGDEEALKAGRVQINSEFKKNKHVTDASEIEKLIQIAEESEKLLRTEVVQGRRVAENTYQVVITKETVLGENTIFQDDAVLPARGRQRKCSDKQDVTP